MSFSQVQLVYIMENYFGSCSYVPMLQAWLAISIRVEVLILPLVCMMFNSLFTRIFISCFYTYKNGKVDAIMKYTEINISAF